jgi:PAS domain S-box-containing protein
MKCCAEHGVFARASRTGRRPIATAVLYGFCWVVFLLAASGAYGAEAKRVLIISMGSRLAPGFVLVDQQLLQALVKIPSVPVETYAENLDLVRFPSERYQQIFTEYLTAKYAAHPPDLVILVFVGNLGIPGTQLARLFPRTPIIVAGLTEEEFRTDQFGPSVSGIAQRVNPRANLEVILRLQPKVRRIVVIGGTTEIDRQVTERVRDAAQSFQGRVVIEFWNKLTMPELRQAVTALPRDTAILFARMFRDGAGQAFISSQVAQTIAESANVPVYVMTDANLGTGAVGGAVASIEAFGKRAGELARLILTGTDAKTLPLKIRTDSIPMFNWPALQRWGIPESRLPPGSSVRYKPTSLWAQYRWHMIGVATVVLLQAAMIIGLLLQRERRRRAEAELSESRQFMELATEAGGIGLWVRDLVQGDLWANPRMRSMLGFDQDDAVKVDDVLARINPDDRAQTMAVIERAQESGEPFEVEFRTAIPGVAERRLVSRGQFVRGPRGQVVRRMGTMIDITERKRIEVDFQRNREELAHVTRVATVGALTTAVAHELNQPLGAILSNAEAAEMFLMAEPPALDEVREILADIRKDDQRASEVIRRMRNLLRKQELAPKLIEINDAVEEVLILLSIDASHRKVALKFEGTADLPSAWCDPVHLQQVVLNLVLNGMEAMAGMPEERRRVIVRTGRGDNGSVKIAVADSGAGIPEDRLPKLFEPFFTTKKDGMGMGLSIARTIVEAHFGKIWAENNSAGGATFYFTVPIAKEASA